MFSVFPHFSLALDQNNNNKNPFMKSEFWLEVSYHEKNGQALSVRNFAFLPLVISKIDTFIILKVQQCGHFTFHIIFSEITPFCKICIRI